MKINSDKTQIGYFKQPRVPRANFTFTFDDVQFTIVPEYIYLGIYIDEHDSLLVQQNISMPYNMIIPYFRLPYFHVSNSVIFYIVLQYSHFI